MSTVFIGGSRKVSRIPAPVKKRLDRIIEEQHHVIIGDASGADKAVQKYLADKVYRNVTVFCSGDTPRNNLGNWRIQPIAANKIQRNFQYFAIKDRAMASGAEFAMMIWDGKSAGTILNVLRMVRVGKVAVLFHAPTAEFITFRSQSDWDGFLYRANDQLVVDLRARATDDEWGPPQLSRQTTLLDTPGWATKKQAVNKGLSDKNKNYDPGPNSLPISNLSESAGDTNGPDISDAVVLERARSLCSEACYMVALQHRRLRSAEPEDAAFLFRWWADLQFMIVALCRLHRCAEIALKIPSMSDSMQAALKKFDEALPQIKHMRNIGEHIDVYAVDHSKRHNKEVDRRQLQVGNWDGTIFNWLGGSLNIDDALCAAENLLEAVKQTASK